MIQWYEASLSVGHWKGRMSVDDETPNEYLHYRDPGSPPLQRNFHDPDQLLRILRKGYWVPSWDEDMVMDEGL
jgi:hypothetical protein